MPNEAGSGDREGEDTLAQRFAQAEELVDCIESGKFSTRELQKRIFDVIRILEQLTMDVSKIGLFSSNEVVDELPTSSLPYFLLPCYLGVLHHNVIADIDRKPEELTIARVYYKDYLKRVREYQVITLNLPWKENDEEDEGEDDIERQDPFVRKSGTLHGLPAMSIEDHRHSKIHRFKMQQDFKNAMVRARKLYDDNNDDDGALRDLYLAKLRFWAFKLLEEVLSIESELPILEMMIKRRQSLCEGHEPTPEKLVPSAPLKPFIIARSEQQKKVLGLGYPAVPTMTVDEWYQQRFGSHGPSIPGPSSSTNSHTHAPDEECNSGSEDEDDVNEETKRMQQIRFDEYKDTHRRGWGNTHNKG